VLANAEKSSVRVVVQNGFEDCASLLKACEAPDVFALAPNRGNSGAVDLRTPRGDATAPLRDLSARILSIALSSHHISSAAKNQPTVVRDPFPIREALEAVLHCIASCPC